MKKTFIICFIQLVQRFKVLNKLKRKSIEKQLQLKQSIYTFQLYTEDSFIEQTSKILWEILNILI